MLSELEGAVLSILARKQPLSAYAIRQEFEASPTESWSASAGSIYPLVKRLIARSLIEEERIEGDGRKTSHLRITQPGKEALDEWVRDERSEIFGPTSDPLRTRGFALLAMHPSKQKQCLRNWREQTRQTLESSKMAEEEQRETPPRAIDILNYSTITELEGRLGWIEAWLETLGNE